MTTPGTSPPRDPRWPRAAHWIADGSSVRPDLALLGVPTFATSISPTGAHTTPNAVRRALERLSTWAPSRGIDLADHLSVRDLGDVDDPDMAVEGEWRVSTRAETAAAMSSLVVLLGGDNSLTAPAMLGVVGSELPRAGLVTLDAHHDLREGRSNGSPVRRLLEAGLDPARVVQVGIADWANSWSFSSEAASLGVTVIGRRDVADRGISVCMTEALDRAGSAGGPVYVDLDVDVCDRSVAPACPASLPGGLSAAELLVAAELAGRHPQVRGVDLTEVDATNDPDGRTVRLVAMAVLETAVGLAERLRAASDETPEEAQP